MTGLIRVATWNVREGVPACTNDPARRPESMTEMVNLVQTNAIDVLALQEVDFTPNGESEVLSALLTRTELQYAGTLSLSESSFEPGKRAGVAIVSRYPVSRIEASMLPNPRLSTRKGGSSLTLHDKGLVVCTLDFGLTEISVASLHSFPFHRFGRDAREPDFANVWKSLSESLPRSEGMQTIICGDFNTEDRSLVLDLIGEPMTRSIYGMATHNGMSIDDILFSSGLLRGSAPKLLSNFSDHELCVMELVSRW
ncbi:endonuclease/exonuclease/phosphatase family protein [Micromonospora sp. NPDC005215]|uniref:endonuclease/exonuclease/phosphatase family protein n=1 Tax=Micromonospora sp. NPDC005215 TaxID=3157024 RepID=UPI0033B6319F